MTKKLFICALFFLLLLPAFVQAQTGDTQSGVMSVLRDPENITFLTFIGANIADAKTDWQFVGPITHRQYTITPVQRIGIVLGGSAVALYVREQFPRARRPITIAMGILTAYFAGRALANTYNHGIATPTLPAATNGPTVAFAVRLH